MKQLEEYRIKADNIMKDLNDEQRLKQKQLVDAETKCLRDVNERYNQEYAYWQNKLRYKQSFYWLFSVGISSKILLGLENSALVLKVSKNSKNPG